ncbi:MAG: DNA mismatch endonuclease, patch repair protein [Microgenomates group bacterium Gr01-1014_16]|nr:MAG: DNA mismatch endonuclease, patch repair protein [Microgenomates group bacterium Gr01-1014_16]
MGDIFTKEKRSEIMSRITGKNTTPELTVRKILRKMGYKYRLNAHNLPGKPDVVIHSEKLVIFVNGCFWHNHKGCKRSSLPKTNTEFWKDKINKNVEKQKQSIKALKKLGWKILVLWQCKINNNNALLKTLSQNL